jgi:hypothetical protein
MWAVSNQEKRDEIYYSNSIIFEYPVNHLCFHGNLEINGIAKQLITAK